MVALEAAGLLRCPHCMGALGLRDGAVVVVTHKGRRVEYTGGTVTFTCHHLDRATGQPCGARVVATVMP